MVIGNVRIKPRFFLTLLLLAALGLGLVYLGKLLTPPKIEWGRLDTDQAITALVLRKEQICTSPESGRFSCLSAEGSLVAEAEGVAVLYRSGYSEKYAQNLLELQQNIKDWQENNILMDVIDHDLEALNTQITACMEEIRVCVNTHRLNNLLSLEEELSTLMQQRQSYMKNSLAADEYLNKLYEQEASLQQKINDTQLQIAAPQEGLISFIFDGCESLLHTDALATLTPSTYAEIEKQMQKGKHPSAASGIVQAQAPLYRLVDANVWYAVVQMRKSNCTLSLNGSCYVTFDGLSEAVEARVCRFAEEGNKVLAVLEMHEGAASMVSLRQITGHIGRSAEGFKLPVEALRRDGGRDYVCVQGADGSTLAVEIEIQAMDNRSAVVSEVPGSGTALLVGMKLVLP